MALEDREYYEQKLNDELEQINENLISIKEKAFDSFMRIVRYLSHRLNCTIEDIMNFFGPLS